MPSPKALHSVLHQPRRHWVGNGFPVRTLFAYPEHGEVLSPFLLLDYAEPTEFPPTSERLGVGEHPHRGFQTVTLVYSGEVEHRDSSGGGGRIGTGDVQWMSAASGLVHEEFHGREFARTGGTFEVMQLWVNLPAAAKSTTPSYQTILKDQIPELQLPEGKLRIVAGSYEETRGPASTFTPMDVWDLEFSGPAPFDVALPEGHSAGLAVRRGPVIVNGTPLQAGEVAVFQQKGSLLHIEPSPGSALLLLSGAPIPEPIAGGGPFVMNTPAEIRQAYADYQEGRMGRL
ncbi:MAG: Pirin domain protein [Holophagaceae bacterium]|nr:Pirin domain protein [Holophagaceae bacterium]